MSSTENIVKVSPVIEDLSTKYEEDLPIFLKFAEALNGAYSIKPLSLYTKILQESKINDEAGKKKIIHAMSCVKSFLCENERLITSIDPNASKLEDANHIIGKIEFTKRIYIDFRNILSAHDEDRIELWKHLKNLYNTVMNIIPQESPQNSATSAVKKHLLSKSGLQEGSQTYELVDDLFNSMDGIVDDSTKFDGKNINGMITKMLMKGNLNQLVDKISKKNISKNNVLEALKGLIKCAEASQDTDELTKEVLEQK